MNWLGIVWCTALPAFVIGLFVGRNGERTFAMRYPNLHAELMDERRRNNARKTSEANHR